MSPVPGFVEFCVSLWCAQLITRFLSAVNSLKTFSCINFAIKFDSDRRLDVCISFFALERETTGLDLGYKTLDIDVIDDPCLGGSSHPLMNIKIGSTTMPSKPFTSDASFRFSVMGFKLTTGSVGKPASTQEKQLRN